MKCNMKHEVRDTYDKKESPLEGMSTIEPISRIIAVPFTLMIKQLCSKMLKH